MIRKENQIKNWLIQEVNFITILLKNGSKIEMYSTDNEGKSVAFERFIRTLKTKIYKYMTSVS